tara:strand:- start:2931 stop:3680 length:750 start_codon:yes stop_codon:yes gene_type:complete
VKVFFGFAFVLFFLTLGCQSAEKKAEVELEKTLIRFSALESKIEKTCLVETKLSEPTQAKYESSFPEESETVRGSKNFIWKIRGNSCEVEPTGEIHQKWMGNHKKIIQSAFCTLLMGFQISSPFTGPNWLEAPREYSKSEGNWTWKDPISGISQVRLHLEPTVMSVSSEKGTQFVAQYGSQPGIPQLQSIYRESSGSGLMISALQFQNLKEGAVTSLFPREVEAFQILIKDSHFKEFQFYGQAQVLRCE